MLAADPISMCIFPLFINTQWDAVYFHCQGISIFHIEFKHKASTQISTWAFYLSIFQKFKWIVEEPTSRCIEWGNFLILTCINILLFAQIFSDWFGSNRSQLKTFSNEKCTAGFSRSVFGEIFCLFEQTTHGTFAVTSTAGLWLSLSMEFSKDGLR